MPKISCFLSSENGTQKLTRNLVGPTKRLTTREQLFYQDAVDAYKHKRQYVLEPMPDTNIGTQPFCAWQVMIDMNRKWKRLKKRKICIVQLGPMPNFITEFHQGGFWTLLAHFLSSYFPGVTVEILPECLDFFEKYGIKKRNHHITGKEQYLVSDIKENIKVPEDAMCVLAVSWTDLYPSEDLNFVLGEANFDKNVAVFCFGRFEPKLVAKSGVCKDITELNGDIVYRLLRVISHEMCHLFGLSHCVYYHCAMNESNSLELALSQPLLCCPFCLRKVQHVLGFRLTDYIKSLESVCSEINNLYPSDFWPKAIQMCNEFSQLLDANTE